MNNLDKIKYKNIYILGIICLLLFIRAKERILFPQVWDEDVGMNPGWYGTTALPNLLAYIKNGLISLLEPVNGYLILVPKIITIASLEISFSYYPIISTVLAWLVVCGILYVVATAPTRLAGRTFLAISCLWIPSNTEVFGLPLYTFWWTSLLLYLLIFWRENSADWAWRVIFIFFAALSSPVIVVVMPLFWLRAYFFRKNSIEIGIGIWATMGAAIQLWVMWHAGALVSSHANQIGFAQILQTIPKFLGAYLIGNIQPNLMWPLGLSLLTFISLSIYSNRRNWVFWVLMYLLGVSIYMSISRVDISIIHQSLAGPRYYFFPFVVIGWFLIQIAYVENRLWMKYGAWTMLSLSAFNTIPVLNRDHDDLKWTSHVNSCVLFEKYNIPVQFDGNSALSWNMMISGDLCRKLLKNNINNNYTYPYRVINESEEINKNGAFVETNAIIQNRMHGKDFYSVASGSSTLPGYEVHGSFAISEADRGEIILQLRRGDVLWFRSEPKSKKQRIIINDGRNLYIDLPPSTNKWVQLEFSNSTLPETFKLKIIDGGDGWGEWSAVGLKNK